MNIHELLNKLKFAFQEKQTVIVMVGLPGVGKSTIIEQIKKLSNNIHVASTDKIIENKAAILGINYSQAFKTVNFKEINSEFNESMQNAYRYGKHIIIDQTNMSPKSRKSKISTFIDAQKMCIVINCDEKIRLRRLDERAKQTGKFIPPHVSQTMIDSYITPSKSEGFDKIFIVDNN